jgi:hypothetical protein
MGDSRKLAHVRRRLERHQRVQFARCGGVSTIVSSRVPSCEMRNDSGFLPSAALHLRRESLAVDSAAACAIAAQVPSCCQIV